jgi:SWI/SNF-related matrix-associated actin-dependent regulator 1 of chromatin subfamily A
MPAFAATLVEGEAFLRFPYDDRLRLLIRAIPGRRWDPEARAWRVPVDPDRAHALTALFETVPYSLEVSDALGRALARRRAKRSPRELVVDVARPDERWWFSFATDGAGDLVDVLLDHPEACRVSAIARGLLPVDRRAAEIVRSCLERDSRLRLTGDARHALTDVERSPAHPAGRGEAGRGEAGRGEVERRPAHPAGRGEAARAPAGASRAEGWPGWDAELARDRRGGRWIVIAAEHAPLARELAAAGGLEWFDGPAGSVALEALQADAVSIAELLARLDLGPVDPDLELWLERTTRWRGTIEVDGPSEAPVFLLLGDNERLPTALRERARTCHGGASMPLTLESWRAIEAQPLEGWITRAAKRCADALEAGRPAPPGVLELSAVHEQPTFVLAPGHDVGMLTEFARLPGVSTTGIGSRPPRGEHEHEHDRLPAISADPFWVPDLDRFISAHDPWVAPDALARLQEIRQEHAHAAGLVALSAATDAPLDLPRLGGELKPFQRAGVRYLLRQRRSFLADEQGLGKTIEALATLEADGAYPAVVVCPASLKLNWMREIDHWLPARTAQMLDGNSGAVSAADITVVNYDIVAGRVDQLTATAPRAVVLDESHYCKNPGAKRTQAAQRLCGAVPRDGVVLALTGTPVMNRPPELISQLRILGRLGDFGSGAQFGQRFRGVGGTESHLRLHWHLRARCFVRRLKAEVLPQLPAKTRAVVPVSLDNEPEYRLAEQDMIAWLRTQPLDLRELDTKVAAALRAERLVRLNALKLLAARGKLHAALHWIHDFLSSGEPLVVFARHREIQHAVLDRFPGALHVLGEDSQRARDQAVRGFQGKDGFQVDDGRDRQLIVCSIEVAGQGITLTRSSNVAFLELDWTPAKHDQAEDRCHRIGQQDAVNATYLLAADTIDETIAALLERKRAVIGAVTDGRDEDERGIVDALVAELRGEPYRHLRAVA